MFTLPACLIIFYLFILIFVALYIWTSAAALFLAYWKRLSHWCHFSIQHAVLTARLALSLFLRFLNLFVQSINSFSSSPFFCVAEGLVESSCLSASLVWLDPFAQGRYLFQYKRCLSWKRPARNTLNSLLAIWISYNPRNFDTCFQWHWRSNDHIWPFRKTLLHAVRDTDDPTTIYGGFRIL